MRFGARAFCLLLLLLLVLCSASASARAILVAAPAADSPLINEFVAELRTKLPQDQVTVSVTPATDATSADIIITLGKDMLNWRLQSGLQTPSIAAYLNRHALPSQPLPAYLTTLLANPKPIRQLRLAKILVPRLRVAGFLYSEEQSSAPAEWTYPAEQSDLRLYSVIVKRPSNLTRDLLQVLDTADVLIGLDDPGIYNADNLKTILLTSYSRSKVLIGPSAPFIEAGSLSTTYSTPGDMAHSVALLLQQDQLPGEVTYPAYFSVLSNAQVARSLGLPEPDDETLRHLLTELEQSP